MDPFRDYVLCEAAIKYWTATRSYFMVNHGIMMRGELPHCPASTATHSQWKVPHEDKDLIFSSYTYVDGFGKACRFVPHFGRAGFGVVDMGSNDPNSGLLDADADEQEEPDPATPPPCGCHNPFYVCNGFLRGGIQYAQ